MTEPAIKVSKNDWIRFQVADKRVLEGFIQEISPDETRILVGKALWSQENEWHNLDEITLFKHQAVNAPV